MRRANLESAKQVLLDNIADSQVSFDDTLTMCQAYKTLIEAEVLLMEAREKVNRREQK